MLLLLSLANVWSATVTTRLDRDTIMAGESVNLRISVEGGNPQGIDRLPSVPGLTIQHLGSGTEFSSINGKTSSRYNLNFLVSATQPGEYTIPPVRLSIGGSAYQSQPVTLTVTRNDISSQENRYAFLRLNVPKQEVYVGEVFPVEIQLYIASRGENLQAPQLKNEGFVIHKQADNTQYTTQIGNTPYNVVSFKMSLSAAKAGQLTLGPAECGVTLLLRSQADADHFGFFGPRYQRRPMTLTSTNYTMTVLPIPATNVPPGFSGAVGQFAWNVDASPTNLKAGDPITIKTVVTGRGNLDALKLPEIEWPNFKAYTPNSTTESTDPLGMIGTKTFEQVVVPETSSITEIPPIQFSFFDPEAKRFRTLEQPAAPITVERGLNSTQPAIAANTAESSGEPPPPQDIVHIKAHPGKLVALNTPPLIQQPWFIALQAIPLLGFVAVAFWRRKQDELANNPRLRRKLQTEEAVRHGLLELRGYANEGQAEPFYSTTFRLLQEQIGERLNLPASAITESVVEDRLPKKGASPQLLSSLHELFQLCNQARYAPTGRPGELQAILPKVEGALGELAHLPE